MLHTVSFHGLTSSVKAVNTATDLHRLWIDPTGNQTGIYRLSSGPSIYLISDTVIVITL